ncbi:hypothetical protein [Solilutibacter oculi]|uniref:hypothetical protein n=1 Tax=Solilutibacter oculi TaxID=2698682 RepID=UPI0013A63467|nr:hypothetical protein [Lysobacter oculi]
MTQTITFALAVSILVTGQPLSAQSHTQSLKAGIVMARCAAMNHSLLTTSRTSDPRLKTLETQRDRLLKASSIAVQAGSNSKSASDVALLLYSDWLSYFKSVYDNDATEKRSYKASVAAMLIECSEHDQLAKKLVAKSR